MTLKILDNKLKAVRKNQVDHDFSETIREARYAVGIKQFRVAEFTGIEKSRLKNLETGYFRDMPRHTEIKSLSELYELDAEILEQQAERYVNERMIRKNVRRS